MKKLSILLLLSLVIVSCKKEATVWETDWSTPIINDTLSLADLVNDSTLAENGGFYDLVLERTLFDFDINDLIDEDDLDTTITEAFAISVLNLTLSPGFSFVNSTEQHDLAIDGAQLYKMTLKSGFIDVTVKNPVATNTHFNLTLPTATLGGVPFNEEYIAPPGSTNNPGILTTTIDLSNYEFDLTGILGTEYNKLTSQVTVKTDPNGPTVNITNLDTSYVQASFRDVEIAYARGYFSKMLSDTVNNFSGDLGNDITGSSNFNLDYYVSGLLDIPATSISLQLENGFKIGIEGEILHLWNENSQGSLVNLTGGQMGSSFNVSPAVGQWSTLTPSITTLNFNSGNSNIEDYIENLGSKHELAYSFNLNPWGPVSGGWDEVFPNSRMRLKVLANMPLNIGMDELVLRDTFEVNLNQDPDKTRVKSGELLLNTSNAFPYSGEIILYLLDAAGNALHTISGTDIIQSAQFGSLNTSLNLMVMDSQLKFVLSDDILEDVNEVKNICVQVRLNSTNPSTMVNEPMPIPVGAFMHVKLKTNFKTENVF